jgi:preprotein translocase subunit SecB
MADEITGNGEGAAAPQNFQQLLINAQYIKDLSFENPRAPQSLFQQAGPPEVEINVDVKARNLGQDNYEVVLTINSTARAGDEPVFIVELAYAAVVSVRNAPESVLGGILMIETPRIIFPFARAIIANATRDGGFPPLLINPIDFAELMRRQQPQLGAGPVPPAGETV